MTALDDLRAFTRSVSEFTTAIEGVIADSIGSDTADLAAVVNLPTAQLSSAVSSLQAQTSAIDAVVVKALSNDISGSISLSNELSSQLVSNIEQSIPSYSLPSNAVPPGQPEPWCTWIPELESDLGGYWDCETNKPAPTPEPGQPAPTPTPTPSPAEPPGKPPGDYIWILDSDSDLGGFWFERRLTDSNRIPDGRATWITSPKFPYGGYWYIPPLTTTTPTPSVGTANLGTILDIAKFITDGIAEARKRLNEVTADVPFNAVPAMTEATLEPMANVGALIGSPLGIMPWFGAIYQQGKAELLAKNVRAVYRPSRLSLGDLCTAFIRGEIDSEKLLKESAELGFREQDVVVALSSTRRMIDVTDLIAIWRRGDLTENELDTRLRQLGAFDEDIPKLKKLSELIPNVPDLISMAVKEAFSPDIARRFGQYEDYPKDITPWLEKQGLSKEWGERYWAAHWDLPSPQMGFEMYHRKIISREDLILLLKSLDIMPFWRDRLIQLAYNPISRVDIRRMHKLGKLKDEDLPLRYEALGYSPDDAKLQAEFTIVLNKEEIKLEKRAEADLTAGEILSSLNAGLIDTSMAHSLLTQLGYDAGEIELKIALADAGKQKAIALKQLDFARALFDAGEIDLNQLIDELNKLPFTESERQYQLADIRLDLQIAVNKANATAKKAAEAEAKAKATQAAKVVK